MLQFNEAIKDCTLPDSSDVYKLKWLIGRLMIQLSCHLCELFILKFKARTFNAAAAEKMLRKVTQFKWK